MATKLKALAIVVLALALAGSAYSAPGRGGGGGGGGAHFGGGGGGMRGGGGGAHFGGGGPHFGGGMRGGGGPHFGGGGIRHFGGGGGAHFGGMRHFGGGGGVRHFSGGGMRHFSGRSAGPRSSARAISRGGGRTTFSTNGSNRTFGGNRNANLRSRAVRSALTSRAVAGTLHNRSALRNPGTRARIAATAATAGWHDGRGRGWWRHGHGGYGWVGPLFWPFAYYDMYDYAMWGYGDDPSFWDYGYNDIYAGMFAPYGYDDLTGYLPTGSGGNRAGSTQASTATTNPVPDQLTQMCGDDSRDIAGLPIDRIQQAIAPNDVQRAALDDLANASVKAAQGIKAACPTQISLTAPARLAAMQQRVEAMIAAVGTVQPPLDKFFGLLDDEQKARLTALGQDQRSKSAARKTDGPSAPTCGATQAGVTDWPTAEIDAKLHPTDAQRASLTALQDASAKAADLLKGSCQTDDALTPPARLAAVGKRLDVMLAAVKTVRTALDDFYGRLSDEQKAQFEAIGPGRSAVSRESTTAPTRHHRRYHASIGGIIRHFMAIAW
jgi:LTXXQ motif family protein